MISGFRKSLRSWATIALLLLALIAIVVTGFGTGGSGGIGSLSGGGGATGDTIARVEGEDVPAAEVADQLNRQFAAAQREQPTLQMSEFLADGAYEQIVNQMIASAALRHFAGERGLVVSDRMVDRTIVNIPQFRNFTGRFDQATFAQMLAAQELTEAAFREDLASRLLQRQLVAPVAIGGRVPLGVAREYADLMLERRRGAIGMVAAQPLAAAIAPTDAEIAAFYRANQRAFTVPERRVVRYAVLGVEQVAQAGAATDEEIARVYRANSGAYGARETRDLQHVVLQTEQAARQFVQRVRGGTSFADAASQAGFSARDITFAGQRREQFAGATTAPVAAAAFSTAQGQVAGPVRSELGFHVFRVERVNSIAARPLAAVRGEIAVAIERRKKNEALNQLVTRIEDQLADDVDFAQIARAERLTVITTPPITAQGRSIAGPPFQPTPELQRLLPTAFGMDAEDVQPVVEQLEANARFALVDVERVEPAAPAPLAQIRDRVRAALVQRRALERSRSIADQIVRRINGGMPAAQAFAQAQAGLPAPERVDMRRMDISQGNQQPPAALVALFSLPRGRAQVVQAPNRAGYFVVFHAERVAGDASSMPQIAQSMRTQFNQVLSEEIAQQFARAIELRTDVSRNSDAIRRARNAASGTGTE